MNKKVLKTMIALVIIFLAGLYVVKIFFPQQFVMSVENKNIVSAGNYVDTHKWLYYIIGVLLGVIFDYLYFGAVCKRFRPNWILVGIIAVYNLAFNSLYTFLNPAIVAEYSNIFVIVSTIYMILLPAFFKADLKALCFTYSINSISQLLTLSIRQISFMLTNVNFVSSFLLTIETYIWMLLCYLFFNYNKKGENKNGMG